MDPFHKNFMNLLNHGSSSQFSESGSQNSPPTPQSQFPFTPPNFLHNFNPFGYFGNTPMYANPLGFQSVQGFHLQGSLGFLPDMQFGSSAIRSASMLHFGAASITLSHASEFNSLCPARQEAKPLVNIEESSDSSEEEPKKGARCNWTEEENKRLLSSWLRHSVDPIRGNEKKSEYYWKEVGAYFNQNAPANAHKRSIKQLRTHWGSVKRDLTKFCGVYNRVRSTWSSGESDEMIMNKAHMMFKDENKGKPFTFDYLWTVVKDLPKWRRVLQANNTTNKRNKISESGGYTFSSNQETEEENLSKEERPEGQKVAKARAKGKGKVDAPSPLGSQPSQNMILYHEAMSIKATAMLTSVREKKYKTYLKLLEKDTSNWSEAQIKRHETIMDQLAKELAEKEKSSE